MAKSPQDTSLPAAFLERMRKRLGPAYQAFRDELDAPAPVSVRLHPDRGRDLWKSADPIPWCADGRYLPERPVFTLDPLFHAGAYYVQEASSMLLAPVIRQFLPTDRPWRILDLCAAPGGKSTLLASLMPPGSLLVANEVIASRNAVLRHNLEKWGYANVVVTQHDVRDFRPLAGYFDLVLVDAPCSGEGLFRKDPAARQEWSEEQVTFCAARQGRILQDVPDLVRPGGVLLYSTCTYNRAENDEQVAWLSNQAELQPLHPEIPEAWGLSPEKDGYQAYPHRLRGEGFFLAAFRRTGDDQPAKMAGKNRRQMPELVSRKQRNLIDNWLQRPAGFLVCKTPKGQLRILPRDVAEDAFHIWEQLRRVWLGTEIGKLKRDVFVPEQGLATSLEVSHEIPTIDLDREQALRYLKGETLVPAPDWAKGWNLVCFAGRGLGWAKVLPNRINNYYPKGNRIRMNIRS